MPHIHTSPGEYDHTASAYVFRIDNPEPRILLHKHKKLHKYMQFGGHIEINETPWQAIIHELREESGYDISQLKVLQPKQRMAQLTGSILHPVPIYHQTHQIDTGDLKGIHFHTDIAYAFVVNEEPRQTVGNTESSNLKLLTRKELADFPREQTIESVREPALYVFDVLLGEWEAVDPVAFS